VAATNDEALAATQAFDGPLSAKDLLNDGILLKDSPPFDGNQGMIGIPPKDSLNDGTPLKDSLAANDGIPMNYSLTANGGVPPKDSLAATLLSLGAKEVLSWRAFRVGRHHDAAP
jgi:hypothetical protein